MISIVDAGIVGIFLLYCLWSGLKNRKMSSQNLEEYFLAGRTLSGWKAGISMAATQFAADTPLLVTGIIATAGIFALWRMWIYTISFLLMGFLLGSSWRRAKVLTDAEIAELRYGSKWSVVLRTTKAFYFGLIFNCTVMAMVLFAAARIAEPFLLWNEWLPSSLFHPILSFVKWAGIHLSSSPDLHQAMIYSANNLISLGFVLIVTMFYSTTGGLRAVVATDLVQFFIAILATLAYAIIVVHRIGGLHHIPEQLQLIYGSSWTNHTLAFTPSQARDISWVVLGTIAIQWFAQMNSDGTGYLAQRTMACHSDEEAQKATLIFVVAQILLRSFIWIAIGLSLLILFPIQHANTSTNFIALREGTFVIGIAQYLPIGIKGLMLSGMLAALASTLDTHLNWGASYFTNDIYKRLIVPRLKHNTTSNRSLVWVARLSNIFILFVALMIFTQLQSIQTAWKASLLLGAGMGIPLLLRWLWWRMTASAELGAILISVLLAPLLLWKIETEGSRMIIMTIATTLSCIIISYVSDREPQEKIIGFYKRVSPPGIWAPIASACGEHPKKSLFQLYKGLGFTLGFSFAIFCLLVGFGTWLFGGPAPTWFPYRTSWIIILLLISIFLGGLLWWKHQTEIKNKTDKI